jgi:hypothetical protein
MTIDHVTTREEGATYLTTWPNLLTGDPEGAALKMPGASDRTIHVVAAVAGSAILIPQGSNEPVPVNWQQLTDDKGDPISFTGGGAMSAVIAGNFLWYRVILSPVGTNADWTAYLLSRSTMK